MSACSRRIEGAPAAPPSSGRRRAVILDRDGVINLDFGYVSTPEATVWVEGIFDFCRLAQEFGYLLLVATNQAGIGRGRYSEAHFASYTRWMLKEFDERGVSLTAVYYCPHHADAGLGVYRRACGCRKPSPGMLLAAEEDYNLDLSNSLMVGDKVSDMMAAGAAGVGTRILLGSGSTVPGGGVDFRQMGTLSEVGRHVVAMG